MHLSLGTEYSRQKQGSWTLEGSPVFLLQPVWPKRHRAVFWWLSPGSHLSTDFKRRSQNNFIVDESFRLIATNSTWVCNYNILKSSLSSLWSHFFPLSQLASSSSQVIFCIIFLHIAACYWENNWSLTFAVQAPIKESISARAWHGGGSTSHCIRRWSMATGHKTSS